jgi:hypothetical protein
MLYNIIKLQHSLSKNYDIILRKAKFVDFGDIAKCTGKAIQITKDK